MTLRILSGSENQEPEGILDDFARERGVNIEMEYQGSLDIMRTLQGETVDYDAVWPASSLWLTAGDTQYRVKHAQSISITPVVFGIRQSLAEELGWAEVGRSFRFLLVQPRHPGKIIGALGFNEIVRGAFQSCFVSYKIDAALWGRGYGSEAIRYGTGWAFRVLGLHRAEANVMPRNAASLRAAEKAGYRPEGLARRYLNINGVWEDHIHMVKLNEEEYHA